MTFIGELYTDQPGAGEPGDCSYVMLCMVIRGGSINLKQV